MAHQVGFEPRCSTRIVKLDVKKIVALFIDMLAY
jgi:hypothetical protein